MVCLYPSKFALVLDDRRAMVTRANQVTNIFLFNVFLFVLDLFTFFHECFREMYVPICTTCVCLVPEEVREFLMPWKLDYW